MSFTYLCIDLKTFYASVECAERGLDTFTTNLVVADKTRGKGALCLAITQSMKNLGIHNRCRLMEIPEGVEYIIAKPRMKLYIQYAAEVYKIFLKYIDKSDIVVYSIDESFLDVTKYLNLYKCSAKELAKRIIDDVYQHLHIYATVGIGTNLYLTKVALDISAKHSPDLMGELDEETYQKTLWHHTPLTDFWNIGNGIVKRLAKYGVKDMFDIAHLNEEIIYREFGIKGEFIIDHAWGKEPCTIKEIKNYKSQHNSLSNGQVLFEDYNYDDALLVVKEMVELNTLELVDKHLVCSGIGLGIGYSKDVHPSSGGTMALDVNTNSYRTLLKAFNDLYIRTTFKNYPIRRINISFLNVISDTYETYDLFSDEKDLKKEHQVSEALIAIKKKYGKNSVVKAMNLEKKATTLKRNKLIGGHNAE
ncbi:MAG: DNA repair protein [Bacilli bacterium]|nr:DNA repair protein [Bacilli bacterium]